MKLLATIALGLVSFSWAPAFADESVEDRLRKLEEENRRIRAQLDSSKDELDALRASAKPELEREVEAYLDATQGAQGGDAPGMQTKKRAFLTFYGFLRLDLYANSARMDSVISPFFVKPETTDSNDDEFAMDVRLTRVGMLFNFGKVGALAATGRLEIDFSNTPSSGVQSRETPRMRLAYVSLDAASWWLRFGQDWDVVSPLIPSINTETAMWKAGNTGDRRPMIRWYHKGKHDGTGPAAITVDVAIGLTGAVNGLDVDDDGLEDGFDSGMPNLQVRVAWERDHVGSLHDDHDGRGHLPIEKLAIGLWAMVSRLQTSGSVGGNYNWTPWMAGIDFTLQIGKVLVRGEAWYAEGAGDFRANTGQTMDETTGELVEGPGGWIEASFRPDERWQFYTGGTIDAPDKSSVPDGGNPTRNWTAYVGARRHWSNRFRTTFDVIYWETTYKDGGLGNAVRLNLWTSYDF